MVTTKQIASLGLALVAWFSAGPSFSQTACEPSGTVSMDMDRSVNVEMIGSPGPLRIPPSQDAYDGYLEIVGGLVPGERKPFFPIKGAMEVRGGDLHVTWWGPSAEDGPKSETINPSDWRYAELIKRARPLRQEGESYIPVCRKP